MGTRVQVVSIGLDGKSKPASVQMGATVINALNSNRKQTGWLWLAESGGQDTKLCFAQSSAIRVRRFKHPILPRLGCVGRTELVTWKSDNFTIEGLLYMPPVQARQRFR